MADFDTECLLDSACVSVHEIMPKQCESCGESNKDETHFVLFDFANNGVVAEVFRGCKDCAENFAAGVAESLPTAPEDEPF